MPPSRAPRMSCGGATSSPACMPSTWSRAGRSAIYDAGEDRYTLYADVKYPHRVRNMLAVDIFRVPETSCASSPATSAAASARRAGHYVEHRLVLWAAKKLGRPVKWACERSEAILADEHARDQISEAELALDADGKFLGLRVRTLGERRRLHLARSATCSAPSATSARSPASRHPGRACASADACCPTPVRLRPTAATGAPSRRT